MSINACTDTTAVVDGIDFAALGAVPVLAAPRIDEYFLTDRDGAVIDDQPYTDLLAARAAQAELEAATGDLVLLTYTVAD